MKRWERPARPLPLRARPMKNETVVSFVARLAAANDFPVSLLLRTIGDCVPGKHVLDRDARLNAAALDRLVVLSRTPAEHLRRALPTLLTAPQYVPLPTGRPVLRFFRGDPHPLLACRICTLQHGPATPVAWEYRSLNRFVCLSHHRWIGEGPHLDLRSAPEIVAAQVQYADLAARIGHNATYKALTTSWQMTFRWLREKRHPALISRWTTRAATLGADRQLPGSVRFPEIVQLMEVTGDPDWRRHVAMVEQPDLRIFYRHTARRLGIEPDAFTTGNSQSDPLAEWVRILRHRFATIRDELWRGHYRQPNWRAELTPFPESCHFE
ncbi:TniQ family protein [Streptomyces sp. TRM64462]|uniref:TniQ family protein n=1 Tax=Streptomyces sp. TRM64462 TaxID=2741726 RepID=UPI001586CDE0|nr:TniQ family protein [Streptomyces sp. TRM64462]